ncbi:DUF4440 domain-containing protein [Actinosynnema sp. ALI-1.44]|uniref:SgcJ/EcaC family oxidoreductase n=1 Tax=Actinosynnema sp. ALI-1.44 TaxID=1933779 RepID=UPI00097C4819|nr:SgcJ/EcaC family oxidoreductase [Actinosynnema sp. ALI-1.44]ONI79725.1 DUF4440 domain-containing protein [Actinosynnema sp. ALI-1.44]
MTLDGIFEELTRAWNAGDGDALAARFAEDTDFVDVLGRLHRGRAAVAASTRQILDTIYRGSRVEFRVLSSRVVGPDLVLVHSTSSLQVPAGPRAGETKSTQTTLVSGGLIVAFHNTIQMPVPEFAGRDL